MAKFDTLVDIYNSSVRSYATQPLFGTKRSGAWTWMTYGEFAEATDAFRGGLTSLGLGAGDCVAIVSNNRVEWAVAAYACFGLGIAFVAMYEAQPPKDWEFIVRDCEAKALIVATQAACDKVKDLLESVPSLKHIISLDEATQPSDAIRSYKQLCTVGSAQALRPRPQDVACLVYTSGTTGNPKGVILTHGNLASNVCAVFEMFPIGTSDCSLSFLPWAHAFGQTAELHTLFAMGASMAICEGVDRVLDNLLETKPTLLFSVPRIFNKLYAAVQRQISTKPRWVQTMVTRSIATRGKQREAIATSVSERLVLAITDRVVFQRIRAKFGGRLRYAFSGGAAISKEVAEFIDGLGITVYEGYGLTETSPIATANWPGSRKIGSVGKAIPGVRVTVEGGELVVYGPNVMTGYHNRPDENAAAFTESGGFRTGDLAHIDDEGFVYITGRIKEQYKLENGKYVVPTPLEEQLKLSPYVSNIMVFGDNRPYNVALVVANLETLRGWAKEHGVDASDVEAMLLLPSVRGLFQGEVSRLSAGFRTFEEVRDFALIADDFTVENGLLTPSLKVKRRHVFEKFEAVLSALYTKDRRTSGSKREVALA